MNGCGGDGEYIEIYSTKGIYTPKNILALIRRIMVTVMLGTFKISTLV